MSYYIEFTAPDVYSALHHVAAYENVPPVVKDQLKVALNGIHKERQGYPVYIKASGHIAIHSISYDNKSWGEFCVQSMHMMPRIDKPDVTVHTTE
jgi:hypothetical protein